MANAEATIWEVGWEIFRRIHGVASSREKLGERGGFDPAPIIWQRFPRFRETVWVR